MDEPCRVGGWSDGKAAVQNLSVQFPPKYLALEFSAVGSLTSD